MRNFGRMEPMDLWYIGVSSIIATFVLAYGQAVGREMLNAESAIIWMPALVVAIIGLVAILIFSNFDYEDEFHASDVEQDHHDRAPYRVMNFNFILLAAACCLDFFI